MTVYELELQCLDFKAQMDAQLIRQALVASPGVGMIDFDLPGHRVRVITANQDGGRDVVLRMSRAGFPPEETNVLEERQVEG
jgi:hypothetical protein